MVGMKRLSTTEITEDTERGGREERKRELLLIQSSFFSLRALRALCG
jgi:hypothetical protein